jgi:hypothetical protein
VTVRPGRDLAPGAACRPASARKEGYVVTKQKRRSRFRLEYARRPTTRRGWLALILAGSIILALKLALGLSALVMAVHLLTR